MSHRRELEEHRVKLTEIRKIMDAMKSMAYMESRKLSHFLEAQQAAVAVIEQAATDLIGHYPQAIPAYSGSLQVFLLLGSERGFCGNFNTALIEHHQLSQAAEERPESVLITVGHKLHVSLQQGEQSPIYIAGASVVEEVETILAEIVTQLSELQQQHGLLTLTVIYHGGKGREVISEPLLPAFEAYRASPREHTNAPLLNMAPGQLFLELSENYLFATLYKVLYLSLMAENQSRVAHLESAVEKLDEKLVQLVSQENQQRQEEIIEEIEIILLSSDNLSSTMGGNK